MANYSQLKQSVKNVIKQNGQQEITGDVLQSVLLSIITNIGTRAQFSGIASLDGNPGTPDGNVYYFAVKPGTYTNFNGLTVTESDGLSLLINMDGTWTKMATGTAMKTDITSLQTSITNINTKILPLSVSFDLDKINALTDSSGSTDIKAAFTPLSGIGVAPVAGNILRSGNVIKNSQEVTVIWSDYDSKTAYYSFSYVIDNVLKIFQTDAKTFVRVAKTVVGGDVGAEIEDLQDKVSIGKAPVWITMTLEGEPHDPMHDNIGDIIFFEEGNYLKEVVRSATGRKTLGQAVDMETGRLYVYGGNLCKWEDGDFVPFYLDDINTLKSKARYEYSLSKILALTDTSGESAVEEAFTPTYAPEGSLSPRVPKAGDLLIDGNNTVVVSEGTQIFFSFTYQEEIISMRVYSGGSSFRFNVWKFPAGTVYDFNSIDTLTESSTADDIKKALTPKIGDGMRIPNSGDIMLIGIEENPDTVSVLYRYRNTFAYYHNRLLTTIEVEGEDDSLRVVKTISRNYVYDFDKINALTNASTFSDIMHAFSPLIIGTEGHIPKTGDLLTSRYDEEGNAVRSAKVICHNGNSFAYCYGGKHVTVELVGDFLGSPDMKIEKTVTDLEGSDVVRLSVSLKDGQSVDIGMTLEELAAKNPTFIVDAEGLLCSCVAMNADSVALATLFPGDIDKNSVGLIKLIVLTDAGSGKVNISSDYTSIVPKLGRNGKLPAEVLPDSAKELLFRDLWDDTCGSYGKYNTETGSYELNGLTDITYEQALEIYNSGMFSPIGGSVETRQYCGNTGIRTNLPYRGTYNAFSGQLQNFRLMFFNCTSIETIRLMRLSDYSESQKAQVGNADMMFYGCTKLRNVYTVLYFGQASNTSNAFYGCSALEEIRIGGLKAPLSFKDSPNLSKESIMYLIQNSEATEAITVTLHATAYEMAMVDLDIQAALRQKPNMSLASA